jgi:hypothetical protein
MSSDPFSAFTVLPFFLLPMYFLAVIACCLILVHLGKRLLLTSQHDWTFLESKLFLRN